MRFGGIDDQVLDRLRLFADVIGPAALSSALKASGGIPLKKSSPAAWRWATKCISAMSPAQMLFLRDIAPFLAQTATEMKRLADVLRLIGKKDQFFLNIAMAMGKAMTDPANGIEGLHDRYRDVPQRNLFCRAGERDRRPLVHGARGNAQGPLFLRLFREGRKSGHGRFRDRRSRRCLMSEKIEYSQSPTFQTGNFPLTEISPAQQLSSRSRLTAG
jgi:uncharacterized protein DUF1116